MRRPARAGQGCLAKVCGCRASALPGPAMTTTGAPQGALFRAQNRLRLRLLEPVAIMQIRKTMGACQTPSLQACNGHRRETCRSSPPGQNPSSPRHPQATRFSTVSNVRPATAYRPVAITTGPRDDASCAGSKNPVLLREAALSEPLPGRRRALGSADRRATSDGTG